MSHSKEDTAATEVRVRDLVLDYGLVFAVGLGAALTLGGLVGILTDAAVLPAIGIATLSLGIICLLSAGLTGGRYASLGVGSGAGRYEFVQRSFSSRGKQPEGIDSGELLAELSRGYRPERDPIAFWLGVAGILYVGLGFAILMAS